MPVVTPPSAAISPEGCSEQAWIANERRGTSHSLYIEPDAAPRAGERCEVLQVSPLLHQLLLSACQLPLLYHEDGHNGALIELVLHELKAATPLPMFTPLPQSAPLVALCSDFLRQPDIHSTPEQWAVRLNKSARTFHRLFRQQTGMAFRDWRQQACLMYALTALREGRTITDVALSLGYEHPAAFTSMFRKTIGQAPTAFVRQRTGGPV